MGEQFIGKVEVLDSNNNVIFTIDPDAGFVQIFHKTPNGQQIMHLTNTGSFSLSGAGDDHGARLDGMLGLAILGGAGRAGKVLLRDAVKNDIIVLDATNAAVYVGAKGNEGDIIVRDGDGRDVFHFDANSTTLRIGITNHGGDLKIQDNFGREVLRFFSTTGTLFIGADGKDGGLIVKDVRGRDFFAVNSLMGQVEVGVDGTGGVLIVRNTNQKETIRLDGHAGDIILSNADCAEDFELSPDVAVAPGTVLVLTEHGSLRPGDAPYDTKVVGVASGAGDCRPGIVLDRRPSDRPRIPVAMVGKVYCNVDATYARIAVGDLLTTSWTPGHAMKATDPRRAFGAVIGKALRQLTEGRALIPIVVALQ